MDCLVSEDNALNLPDHQAYKGLNVSFFTEIISKRARLARKPEVKELKIKRATRMALAAMMKSCLPCAVS